jgi:hypothetical protein
MGSTCQCRSRTLQDATLPHAPETLSRTVSIVDLLYWVSPYLATAFGQVPTDSKVRSTPMGTRWDARVTVRSIATQPTHQAAARALTTPLELALILASHITRISVRPSGSGAWVCCVTDLSFLQSQRAPIHMCTHMTSQAELHFGLAPRRPMRLTRLPSALKSSMRWVVFVYRNTCPLFIFSVTLQW